MEREGSITIFCAMALMLVASFILALLETGRFYGLDERADMVSEVGIESVFAEYQPAMWEYYNLLGLDGGYGGSDFSIESAGNSLIARLEKNLDITKKNNELFALELSDVSPTEYELITDSQGEVFISYVAEKCKDNLTEEAISRIYRNYMEQDQVEQQAGDDGAIESAEEEIEREIENAKTDTESSGENADTGAAESAENPLKIASQWKKNAILGTVVEDVSTLSTKQVDLSDALTRRKLVSGTKAYRTASATDKIIAIEYMDGYMGNYRSASSESPLSYEMEYVVCGYESDKANLEGVVKRLLVLRESANVIHIIGDSEKMSLAAGLSTLIAGFTLNPIIIKAVETAIIMSWAYLESVEDVRALLAGDKIALLKSKSQWTLDLNNLTASLSSTSKAKSCDNGLTYEQYIKGFLCLENVKDLSCRMMDLMEMRVRATEGYANFRMDHVILEMKYGCSYKAVPLFSGLMTIGNLGISEYKFNSQAEFAY